MTYIVAIFGTYLALGLTMMLGLDAVLPSVRPLAEGRLGFIVQSLIGLAMLGQSAACGGGEGGIRTLSGSLESVTYRNDVAGNAVNARPGVAHCPRLPTGRVLVGKAPARDR